MNKSYLDGIKNLAMNYSLWFVRNLPPTINLLKFATTSTYKFDEEKMYKSKKSLSAAANLIFKTMLTYRFKDLASDDAFDKKILKRDEKWLKENIDFKYGGVGLIMDIFYIETEDLDHTSKIFKELMFIFTKEVVTTLIENNCLEPFIFGEIVHNKTFQKKVDADDLDEVVKYIVKRYSSEFV